jgi:hypothetical protein
MTYKDIYKVLWALNTFGPVVCACKWPQEYCVLSDQEQFAVQSISTVDGKKVILCGTNNELVNIAIMLCKEKI